MLKRYSWLLFLLLAVIIPFGIKNISGAEAEFTYQRAYQDYIYYMDLYRQAYNEFQLARSQYLQSKTLTAKSNAQSATLKLLQTRDEVVKTQLTAIRQKIQDTAGISSSEKQLLYSQIDSEVAWFDNHKKALTSAGTLEDLVKDNEAASERYKGTLLVSYGALNSISVGKIVNFRETISKIITDINKKVSEIRENDDKETQKIERWLLETDNRLTRSREKEQSARNLISSIKPDQRNIQDIFNDSQFTLEESYQFIKEANNYLKEIVREIKTAD
jgi:hypothetical protein